MREENPSKENHPSGKGWQKASVIVGVLSGAVLVLEKLIDVLQDLISLVSILF